MRKIFLALALLCSALTHAQDQSDRLGTLTVALGVYDPDLTFANVPTMSYEHVWWQWNKTTPFPPLKEVLRRGRIPLITIEPWPIPEIGEAETLLPDIAAGKYDKVIAKIAKEIDALDVPVIIRWGHEMECVPTYPWSQRSPADYIAAFRHAAALFQLIADNSKMLWSPVGNPDCGLYYPGDDVVDYVGFTIFEFPQVSTSWFGHPASFTQWMDEKYPRVKGFNKPVIIAELGIYAAPEVQKAWIKKAIADARLYPLLKAIIYFNSKDSHAWGWNGKVEIPNWTINPATFTL